MQFAITFLIPIPRLLHCQTNTPHNVFSLEGGTVRAGGRGDGILRWDLPRSGQARISCITDRCSRRYALVNLWLQLYLARTPLCLPWPSSCLVLPTTQPSRGTPDTCRQESIWPPIGPKIRLSSQDEECHNFTKHKASQPLLKS